MSCLLLLLLQKSDESSSLLLSNFCDDLHALSGHQVSLLESKTHAAMSKSTCIACLSLPYPFQIHELHRWH